MPVRYNALLLSLLIHIIVFVLLALGHDPSKAKLSSKPSKTLKIELKRNEKGTLVELSPSAIEQIEQNNDAKYLSDRNVKTKTQTQAKHTSNMDHSQKSSGQASSLQSSSQRSLGNKSSLQLPNAFIDRDTRQYSLSYSPSNYLPELEYGEQTILNTRSYVYASFFLRMKQQMQMYWSPQKIIQIEKLHQDKYITTLSITLDKNGNLLESKIIESSSNDLLDQEAIMSVKSAAPFLNPPQGLIENDGLIKIDRWMFIVYRSKLM